MALFAMLFLKKIFSFLMSLGIFENVPVSPKVPGAFTALIAGHFRLVYLKLFIYF